MTMQNSQLAVPDPVGICHTRTIPRSPTDSGWLKELWLWLRSIYDHGDSAELLTCYFH